MYKNISYALLLLTPFVCFADPPESGVGTALGEVVESIKSTTDAVKSAGVAPDDCDRLNVRQRVPRPKKTVRISDQVVETEFDSDSTALSSPGSSRSHNEGLVDPKSNSSHYAPSELFHRLNIFSIMLDRIDQINSLEKEPIRDEQRKVGAEIIQMRLRKKSKEIERMKVVYQLLDLGDKPTLPWNKSKKAKLEKRLAELDQAVGEYDQKILDLKKQKSDAKDLDEMDQFKLIAGKKERSEKTPNLEHDYGLLWKLANKREVLARGILNFRATFQGPFTEQQNAKISKMWHQVEALDSLDLEKAKAAFAQEELDQLKKQGIEFKFKYDAWWHKPSQ